MALVSGPVIPSSTSLILSSATTALLHRVSKTYLFCSTTLLALLILIGYWLCFIDRGSGNICSIAHSKVSSDSLEMTNLRIPHQLSAVRKIFPSDCGIHLTLAFRLLRFRNTPLWAELPWQQRALRNLRMH